MGYAKIDITFALEVLNTQVIVIIIIINGTAGFTPSWLSAAIALVTLPILILTIPMRNLL